MKIIPMGLVDVLNILFFKRKQTWHVRNRVLFMLIFLVEEPDCMQRCLDEGIAKDHPNSASVP